MALWHFGQVMLSTLNCMRSSDSTIRIAKVSRFPAKYLFNIAHTHGVVIDLQRKDPSRLGHAGASVICRVGGRWKFPTGISIPAVAVPS
jgi:hypothetical protein